MRVRLLVARATVAGPEHIGAVVTVSDAEAVRMIEAGQAAPMREAAVERAVPPDTAERATPRRKYRKRDQ